MVLSVFNIVTDIGSKYAWWQVIIIDVILALGISLLTEPTK